MEARLEEFRKAGARLQELGDKQLTLALRRDLRTLAKPVAERVLNALADAMPHRGGLSDKVREQGRVSVLINLKSGVRIQLANRGGMFMGAFEKGTIRHPVMGHRDRWVPQEVPGNAGATEFTKDADALGKQVADKLTDTLKGAM